QPCCDVLCPLPTLGQAGNLRPQRCPSLRPLVAFPGGQGLLSLYSRDGRFWRLNGLNTALSRPMTPEEFQKYYPRLLGWIDATLRAHAANARTVISRGFPRLPLYFAADTLTSAKVVLVDELPIPPLSSWGLTRFADFERGDPDGITYLDTFFLKRRQARSETLHFHELIHVIQWRLLGPEGFIRSYANGLERFGYRDNPLEAMAYEAEAAFTTKHV